MAEWGIVTETGDTQYGRMELALSEGKIGGLVDGLKSIYLDGTPVQGPDVGGGKSFNFTGVSAALVLGTNTQGSIPGFASAEDEVQVNQKVTLASPVARTITTQGLSAVRVKVSTNNLSSANSKTGVTTGTKVEFTIDRQNPNYTPEGGTLGAWETVVNGVMSEKKSGTYVQGYRIPLPALAGQWQIRVTRITADHTAQTLYNDCYIYDDIEFQGYTEIIDAKLRSPHTAKLAVLVSAKQFPTLPQVHSECYGIEVNVPSNYTPASWNPTTKVWTAATYDGIWDGTFKRAWTANPAWLFFEMATNPRFGAGDHLAQSGVDKWALYAIGKVCDQMVDDGKGGLEPRFSAAIYLQAPEDAIKVLGNLASAFRGMLYSAGSMVTPVQDVDSAPVALFTKSNVIDGKFTYQGSARSARHTAAMVSWIDPNAGCTKTIEYVEDPDAIARFGLQVVAVEAIGCISQAGAQRFGRWTLETEQRSTETVTFGAGLDSSTVHPGDVIQVQDNDRAGSHRMGGRVVSATTTSVTLDSPVTLGSGTYYLRVRLTDGTVESQVAANGAGTFDTLTVGVPFSSAPQPQSVWICNDVAGIKLYRVVSISEKDALNYSITALLHDPAKYAAADRVSLTTTPGTTTGVLAAPVVSLRTTVAEYANQMAIVLAASWPPLTGASDYRAEYSFNAGPWATMPVSGCSAEAVGVLPGSYRVRVSATYQSGKVGPFGMATLVVEDSQAMGILTPSEKVQMIADWTTAQADFQTILNRAKNLHIESCTPCTDFVTKYQALETAINGMNPALTDLSQSTILGLVDGKPDGSAFFALWAAFNSAKTRILATLQTAMLSILCVSDSNMAMSGTGVLTVDGVTTPNGSQIMLAGQTTPTENGIYVANVIAGGGGAPGVGYARGFESNVLPSASNMIDEDLSTYDSFETGYVILKSFAGSATSGTLSLKLKPSPDRQEDSSGGVAMAGVYASYSVDGGASWHSMGEWQYGDDTSIQTVTTELTYVPAGQLRVKIQCEKDYSQGGGGVSGSDLPAEATSYASVYGATFGTSAAPPEEGSWFLSSRAAITDGDVYCVSSGTTYGRCMVTTYVSATGAVTLVKRAAAWEFDLGKPSADGMVVMSDADGKRYWGEGGAGTPGKDATAHETTKDLVLDADHGSIDLGLLSQFQRITFSGPGRLRIYVSEAARVADLSRPLAVDAVAGTGCLLEVTPNLVDGLGGSLTPLFTAAPEKGGDGLCYWTWEGPLGTTCSLEYYTGTIAGTTIIPKDGTNVHQEPRDPLPSDGVTNETWINNLTWDTYHKEAGSWVLTGNIKGATGPQGEKGDTGAAGATGAQGPQGEQGPQGLPGQDGATLAHASNHAPGGSDALPWATVHGMGTTAQKPAASASNAGYLWFDTTLAKLQRSNGTAWEDYQGASGGGGGADLTNIPIGTPAGLPSAGNVQIYPAYALENLVPNMTSDTAPSGVCSASEYYSQYPPWQAFSDSGTGWVSNGSALPQSLQYQPAAAITVLAYEITPWSLDYFPSTTPTEWVLQGLSNGTWVGVDTRSVSSSSWVINTPTRFTLSSPASYEAYRLYITANGGRNYVGIRRLKLLGLGTNIAMFMRDSSGNVKQFSTL